jgi:hypothetical protein
MLLPVVAPTQQREGYGLACVSRVGPNLYGTMDNFYVRTSGCGYDARCDTATLYPRQSGLLAVIEFSNGIRCSVDSAWKAPSQ